MALKNFLDSFQATLNVTMSGSCKRVIFDKYYTKRLIRNHPMKSQISETQLIKDPRIEVNKGADDVTPLHVASQSGHEDTVRL